MPYLIRGISKTGLCSWVERGAGDIHFGPRECAAVFSDERQAWFVVAQIPEPARASICQLSIEPASDYAEPDN
jgi:hypothetical protein